MSETSKEFIAPELKQLLRMAHDEIISLRARLAYAEPKAEAYDTIAQIASLSKKEENRGYSVDVAWRIKEAVEKDDDEARRSQPVEAETVDVS